MGKPKKTTEEFILEAKSIHGDAYDYTNTIYKGAREPITFICPEHGEVTQLATNHLRGAKCKFCQGKGLDQSRFVSKASKVHGSKYIYKKVVFINSKTKVTITCPTHGDFDQRPDKHLIGDGCPKCSSTSRKSKETFIAEAREVHGSKYGYEEVDYKGTDIKVKIKCGVHGMFEQAPSNHLKGYKCPKCAIASRSTSNMWSYSDWEKAGKASPMFEGFSLYIIQCTGNGEKFIKIGKTFRGVAKRFAGDKDMPYKYKVITQVYHNAYAISKLEEKLHRHFKEYKYKPKREFAGMYECYDVDILDEAVEKAEK
jgi:hypothetical protein